MKHSRGKRALLCKDAVRSEISLYVRTIVTPLTGVTIAFSRHYGRVSGVSIRQGVCYVVIYGPRPAKKIVFGHIWAVRSGSSRFVDISLYQNLRFSLLLKVKPGFSAHFSRSQKKKKKKKKTFTLTPVDKL